jgi:hypothetical protein
METRGHTFRGSRHIVGNEMLDDEFTRLDGAIRMADG